MKITKVARHSYIICFTHSEKVKTILFGPQDYYHENDYEIITFEELKRRRSHEHMGRL